MTRSCVKSVLHRVVWCRWIRVAAWFGRAFLCPRGYCADEVTAGDLLDEYCELTCSRCGSRVVIYRPARWSK